MGFVRPWCLLAGSDAKAGKDENSMLKCTKAEPSGAVLNAVQRGGVALQLSITEKVHEHLYCGRWQAP